MSPAPRGRFPSRPDPRVEEITPVHGTPVDADATPTAVQELREQIAELRTRVEDLEDWCGDTKTRHVERQKWSEKWGGRAWAVFQALAVGVLLYALLAATGRIQCAPPKPQPPEVRHGE